MPAYCPFSHLIILHGTNLNQSTVQSTFLQTTLKRKCGTVALAALLCGTCGTLMRHSYAALAALSYIICGTCGTLMRHLRHSYAALAALSYITFGCIIKYNTSLLQESFRKNHRLYWRLLLQVRSVFTIISRNLI